MEKQGTWNLIKLGKQTWNNNPNNGMLTLKQQKMHGAVQKLPCLFTKELNRTLFQNNRFPLFLFVQH